MHLEEERTGRDRKEVWCKDTRTIPGGQPLATVLGMPLPRAGNWEVNVGYEPDPETMGVVKRILTMLADGRSLHQVQRELEQGGVPAPGGGAAWSRTTIKGIAADDLYRPHAHDELKGVVPADVLAGLEPEEPYGIHWSGRKRSKFKNHRSKQRVVHQTPPEEWTAVPVSLAGSGLERATVDRARANIEGNRSPSKVAGRFWDLSGGILRCGDCGRAMIAYQRGQHSYYRCRPSSTLANCPNRKSHRAERLEEDAATLFNMHVDAGKLLRHFDRATEEEDRRADRRGSRERRAALSDRLETVARMRRGFQDQQAEGLMTLAELRERLEGLDEERAGIEEELSAAQDAGAGRRQREAARGLIRQLMHQGQWLTLLAFPQERRAEYARFGARFAVDPDGKLTLRLNLPLVGKPLQTGTTS